MHEYLTFWHVDTAVFLRPVASAEMYFPEHLRESLARLKLLCTTEPRALIVVTGTAGTGKSSLLRWLADTLPITTHEMVTLSLVQEEHDSGWLAPRLADVLGVHQEATAFHGKLGEVTKRMDELADSGKRILLAIDSAHLIRSAEALSEILALLNIQSLSTSCMTFLLTGEPDILGTLLKVPGLLGKITLHVRLDPLTLAQTQSYLEHRLRVAGLQCPFAPEAIEAIQLRSQGIMAGIDIYAEHCLIEGHRKNNRQITLEIAQSAAQHLAQPHGTRTSPIQTLAFRDETKIGQTLEGLNDDQEETSGSYVKEADASRKTDTLPLSRSHHDLASTQASTVASPQESESQQLKKPPEDTGSASIRLSSLFKSVPGRSKPKGP
jgi:general secretion pathway protein A